MPRHELPPQIVPLQALNTGRELARWRVVDRGDCWLLYRRGRFVGVVAGQHYSMIVGFENLQIIAGRVVGAYRKVRPTASAA